MTSSFENFPSTTLDRRATLLMIEIINRVLKDLEHRQKAQMIGRQLLQAIEEEVEEKSLSWLEQRRRQRSSETELSADEIDVIFSRAIKIAAGRGSWNDEATVRVLKTLASLGNQAKNFRFSIDELLAEGLVGSAENGRFFRQRKEAEGPNQIVARLEEILPNLDNSWVLELWQNAADELSDEWQQWWAKDFVSPIVIPKPSRLSKLGTRRAGFDCLAEIMIGWQEAERRQGCFHSKNIVVPAFLRPKELNFFGHPRTEEAIRRLEGEQPGDFLVIPAMEDFHLASARRAEILFNQRQFALGVFECLAIDMVFGIRDHHNCAGDAVWQPGDFPPKNLPNPSARKIPDLSTWWQFHFVPDTAPVRGSWCGGVGPRRTPPDRNFVGLDETPLRSDLAFSCCGGIGWLTAFLPKQMGPLKTPAFLTDMEWWNLAKKTL
jgi:hypothetical protein